jgi:hypothetical protein
MYAAAKARDGQGKEGLAADAAVLLPDTLFLSVYRGGLPAGAQRNLVGVDAPVECDDDNSVKQLTPLFQGPSTRVGEAREAETTDDTEELIPGMTVDVEGVSGRVVSITSDVLDENYELQCRPFHPHYGTASEYSPVFTENVKRPGWTFYLFKRKETEFKDKS